MRRSIDEIELNDIIVIESEQDIKQNTEFTTKKITFRSIK